MLRWMREIATASSHVHVSISVREYRFSSLTPELQKILLSKRQIIFQEKQITLEKLMEIEDVNNLSKVELDYLDKIIYKQALIKLMENEDIKVGIKRPHLSDLESIYYIASVTIVDDQLFSAVRSNPSDLFVIGGTTKDEFSTKLNAKEKDAVRVLGQDVARKGDRFIILTNNEEENLENFKRICSDYSDVEDDVLSAHLIEMEYNVLIWKRSYDATFYRPRNLFHVVMQKDSLEAHIAQKPENGTGKKDIFAISSISVHEFKKLYGIIISEYISTENNPNQMNHVIILEGENEEERFENLCSNKWLEYYNIHLLQHKGDKLVWKRSKGEINKIREMQDTRCNFPINEDDLNQFIDTEQVVVIAGESGMGKSTTLTHLLKKAGELEWVIELNLVDMQEELKELKECGVNYLEGIIEKFFSKIDIGVKGKLAKGLLKYRIERQGKITLLFNGFDEVAHTNQNAVIHLLRYLKSTKAKIRITTRLNLKEKLENELCVLSYTLQPFSKEIQKEFSQKFWKTSFKLKFDNKINNDKLDRNIGALFEGIYRNINDNRYEFLSIPLLTRMFAEIYQNTVEDSYRSDSPVELLVPKIVKELSILDLYEKFIESKYAIYFREKTKIKSNNLKRKLTNSFNKGHQRLAFQKLFSKNELMKILGDKSILHSEDEENKLKLIGIIQSINGEGDTYFIHNSFAEYFVACLLVDMIKERKNSPKYKLAHEFLLIQIFTDRNEAIRVFFGNMIQKEHDGNLNSEWETIKRCDLLGQIETKGLLFLNSVEAPNIGTEVQHDAESGKSLAELKQDVELCMNRQNDDDNTGGYYYDGDVELINNLFQQFLKETDIQSLQITLEFLIKAYGKEYKEKTNEVFSRNNNIYNATKHYVTEAEKQPDRESVLNVFSSIPEFRIFNSNLDEFDSLPIWTNQKKVCAKRLSDFLTKGKPQHAELIFCAIKVLHPRIMSCVIKNIEINIRDMTIADYIIRKGIIIENLKYYKILTPEMSKKICSTLAELLGTDRSVPDLRKLYVSTICNYLIIPTIDMIMRKELHDVNEWAFFKLLTYFTRFSVEHEICFSFTTHQLKTTLELIEKLLKHDKLVQEVLVESTEYLFALGKVRIKLINTDQGLLVLDPACDFQYKLSTYRDEIVEGIRGKLKADKKRPSESNLW